MFRAPDAFYQRLKECLDYSDTQQMEQYKSLYSRDFHQREFPYLPSNMTYTYKMSKLYRLINDSSTRNVMEQAYYLEQTSRINSEERVRMDEKFRLYHYSIPESQKKMIKDKCIEYDTAIGLSITLYQKMDKIQSRLRQGFKRLLDYGDYEKLHKLSIYATEINQALEEWCIENNTFFDKLEKIVELKVTQNTLLEKLLLGQWMIIELSQDLYESDYSYKNVREVLINIYEYQERTEKIINYMIKWGGNGLFESKNFDEFAYWAFFAPMEAVSEHLYIYLNSFKEELFEAKEISNE